MNLNGENYYSQESNAEYWSVSQYKDFVRCEAAALARLKGEYSTPPNKAMLVGSYIDSYFEGALDKFKQEHPEILTKQGTPKADFKQADEIIETVNRYPLFLKFMGGEKQKILTFDFAGAKWKMKMDSYIPGICITDLKIVRNIPSLPQWRYDLQGAVYQKGCELNGLGKLPFYLAVATKEEITDVRIFQIPQTVLDMALAEIEGNMERYIEVKAGRLEPERCGECEYCRRTRELEIENYASLFGE